MTTTQEQLGKILHALGGLEAEVKSLRRDVETARELNETDKEHASESRARTFDRIDELASITSKLEGDVRLAVATAAQARDASSHTADQVKIYAEKLDAHITEVLPIMGKVRRLEWRVTLFLTGLTMVGGGIWWLITSNAGAIWKLVLQMLPRG